MNRWRAGMFGKALITNRVYTSTMKLTKCTRACVAVETSRQNLAIDLGSMLPRRITDATTPCPRLPGVIEI